MILDSTVHSKHTICTATVPPNRGHPLGDVRRPSGSQLNVVDGSVSF